MQKSRRRTKVRRILDLEPVGVAGDAFVRYSPFTKARSARRYFFGPDAFHRFRNARGLVFKEAPVTTSSKTPLLDTIALPLDLRRLKESDLAQVADELRT